MAFLLLFIFCSATVSAQQKTVSGLVSDLSGEPIIGANVHVKGIASVGTSTDIDGKFTLAVPEVGKILIISYLGFITQELPIDKTTFAITLKEDLSMLEEIVVIGYGTAKRKDLLGSVGSVSGSALAAIPVSSAAEAITGKLAGVQVTTTEGSPDAEIKIRVRGGGSITGDNMPLFIVDGFPVQSISDIPPGDIESIDVLKDASSTAIYGSRGANGVVIVTTKSGKEGKTTVSYNAYYSWKKIANTLETLTPSDYVHWQYERAMLADNKPDAYARFFGNYQDIDIYDNITGNNWQEQVFGRIGSTFNHNLSINGGGEKTQYAFSYNHINDKAIMQGSDFKRDNLSLKLNNTPHKDVKIDFSVRYSNTAINGSGMNEQNTVSSADYRLKYAMIFPPIPVSGLTDEGNTDQEFNLYDPLVTISDNDRKQVRTTFNLAGGITWEVIDNLRLRTEVGLDDYRLADDRFYGQTTYYVKNVPAGGDQGLPAIVLSKLSRKSYRNTNTLNYDFKKLLSDNHKLNFLLGQETIFTYEEELKSTVHGFPSSFTFEDASRLSTQGHPYSIDNQFKPDDKLISFFGRINYDYQSKYLLSATYRADGSSKFSEGNKWGYFPSVSGAWRISSESFMEGSRSWLTDLKLRASYGTAGNNKIPSGQMAQTYSSSSTSWVNGFGSYWAASKTMANPDLKWETTVTRNLGLDITTLNGRLSGSVELYQNNTKDLLIQFPTPGTGYDNQYRNMGETQNKGVEFTLNYVIADKKNFGLNFSGNIGFNKNEIKSLGLMDNFTGSSGWASTEIGTDYWIATGGSVGRMFGYKSAGRYEVSDFAGYDAAKGTWILKDGVVDSSPVVGTLRPGTMKLSNQTEGDLLVNEEDKVIIGDANPLHTGGFTVNSRLYGFDLSANFNWSYGNDIYNANKIEYTTTSKYHSRNMIATMATGERWNNLLPDGTICNDPVQLAEMNRNTTLWSPYMRAFTFTDWAVEDGSFLRLSTLTLGYIFPSELTKKALIKTCRFYVTGYNVFCWTNYSGFDPEVSTLRKTALTPGVDYSAYPRSRSIVLGLNLTF
jgi:TonB-linked SusC/RagA family outer membrane protein